VGAAHPPNGLSLYARWPFVAVNRIFRKFEAGVARVLRPPRVPASAPTRDRPTQERGEAKAAPGAMGRRGQRFPVFVRCLTMAKKRERGNGTGTVYPRKNKQGKIISYLGAYHGPDGKRRYVSAKKGECQRRLREAMTDAVRGLIFDRSDLKLGEYLDSWLSDSAKDTVRQRTWERYESICRVHIKPTLGTAKLRTLTSNHLRALYRDKLDAGLAPRTST
jgi:Phage integrase, N-terminal SAM-like domain